MDMQNTCDRKKSEGKYDPGWNDPPTFSYNAQTAAAKPRLALNKRVAFPLNSAPPTSNVPLNVLNQMPPILGGLPLPTNLNQNVIPGGIPLSTNFNKNLITGEIPLSTNLNQNPISGGVPLPINPTQNLIPGGISLINPNQNFITGEVPPPTNLDQNVITDGIPFPTNPDQNTITGLNIPLNISDPTNPSQSINNITIASINTLNGSLSKELVLEDNYICDVNEVVDILNTILDDNRELGSKLEDIKKRINVMKTMWIEGKLVKNIQVSMLKLVKALQIADMKTADELHKSLMVDHVSSVSSWMVAIKQLILHCAAKNELLNIDKEE